jgi:endonuclease/exonuclease/phosphatase family metal-dependent hydrolase
VSVIEPRLSRSIVPPDPAIRLVVANVWGENPTPDAVPESMTGRGADVLVAIEVSDDELFAALAEGAAAQGLDSTVEQGRQGVWSRFPVQVLDELGLPSARALRVGVDVPGSPFVLYVVHGLNPLGETSFDDQLRFTEDLLTAIETEERPVVVAGDLNMSDRVVSYRKMDAALTDAMRAGAPGSTTYVGGWWPTLLLRIDHVFVTPSWCATRPVTFTPAGSDHRGVDVAVGPCD